MAYNSTIDKAVDDILIYGNTVKDGSGTSYVPLLDADGHLQLDVLTSGLPTGASTSANQTTIIGHLDGVEGLLTTIDGDTGNIAGDIDSVIDTVSSAITGAHAVIDTRAVLFAANAGGTYGNIERTNGGNLKVAVEEFDTSLPAGTNNIGDVDVLTINGVAPAFGSGVRGATVQRVTIATDDSVPVTNAGITTIAGAVSGTEMQVDVLTMPTVTVNAHAVTNAGTFATQESQILADNAGFTDGTTKVFAAGYIYDEVAGTALTENDVAAARINVNRGLVNIIEDGVTRGRYATVTASNALKVDASGVAVPITDNSGSITVDYATTGSGTATGALRVELPTNGTGTVGLNAGTNAIGKLAANSGVDIGDVDILSIIPGTGATNLGKARDSAIGATDTGVAMLGVRRNTPTAETPAAGDYVVPQYSANGEAWVRLAGELADDAAFTVATTRVLPTGLLADETSPDSVDEGDIGIPRMTLDRKAIVTSYPSSTTGDGLSVANFNSGDTFTALTNTAQVIKASAGNFYGYYIYNPNSSATYVMLYNTAAASVTVGTTTPYMVFCIPATSGANLSLTYPIPFTNAGWSIAAATTGGGNTAPTTALEAMIFYK